MKDNLLKLAIKMRILLDEEGQDLIEYALVVALIAFAATAGMSTWLQPSTLLSPASAPRSPATSPSL